MRIPSSLVGALVAGAFFVAHPDGERGLDLPAAHATTSVLLTLDELVLASERIAVVRATERKSQWEEVAGSRRIVTYTKLEIDQTVDGPDQASSVWVRTLGGRVGDLGQHVAGEAQLRLGERALVFLARGEGAVVVAGMAQGHFPIVELDGARPKLAPSPDAGRLLPRRGPSLSAREALVGKALDEALDGVRARVGDLKKRDVRGK
jgi:hypothetical protein